jgi:uncharacterized protein (TIGR00255 family)
MTGYATQHTSQDGLTAEVEIKSWNHKGCDSQIRLPDAYVHLEAAIRDELSRLAARGKISCTVRVRGQRTGDPGPEILFNESRVAGTIEPFRRLAEKLHLTPHLSLSDILEIPGALEVVERPSDAVAAQVLETFRACAKTWDASRSAEGERMHAALEGQIVELEAAVERIDARSRIAPQEQRARLKARVDEVLATVSAGVDEKRVELEIALLVEKSDVHEELIRLRSHLVSLRKLVSRASRADGPVKGVGSEIGFTLQELLRETNTVGSKTQDIETLQSVIAAKTAIDRIKEVAANVV